jgi:GNAT superfamily N-acetyltransferase
MNGLNDTLDLAELFVMPGRLRHGIGRAIFAHAIAAAHGI